MGRGQRAFADQAVHTSGDRQARPDDESSIIERLTAGVADARWDEVAHLWKLHGIRLASLAPAVVTQAFAAVPRAAIERHPILGSAVVATATLHHSGSQVEHWQLIQAAGQEGARRVQDALRGNDVVEIADSSAGALIHRRLQGKWEQALKLGEAALRRIDSLPGTDHFPIPPTLPRLPFQLGMTHLLGGSRARARELAFRAFTEASNPSSAYIAADASGHIALIDALDGAGPSADAWLRRHRRIDVSGHWGRFLVTLPAHLAQSLRHLERLDVASAKRELTLITGISTSVEMWPYVTYVEALLAIVEHAPQDGMLRFLAVRATPPSAAPLAGPAIGVLNRAYALLLIANGSMQAAKEILAGDGTESTHDTILLLGLIALLEGDLTAAARLTDKLAVGPSLLIRCRALMISAAATLSTDQEGAVERFRLAVAIARTTDSMLPYLWIDLETRLELASYVSDIPPESWRPSVFRPPRYQVHLTVRERTILEMMAAGSNRAETAKALFLSEFTVRNHLYKAYKKLDVRNLADAVAAGYRLGLISA